MTPSTHPRAQMYMGERQSGEWPFTPYTVRVRNFGKTPAWAELHIDGQYADQYVVKVRIYTWCFASRRHGRLGGRVDGAGWGGSGGGGEGKL